MSAFDPARHLPDDLLERIRERAAVHDRENTFPQQDLDELREAGYLSILVPRERGGAGLGLVEAAALQQRLACAAPATALAINMHLVWTGVAKVFSDRGMPGLEFVQDGAVAGDVFAFGISEGGNDLVLFGSDTDAAPQPDGGYAFTGTKIFTSLAPVWTKLGLHGLDTTDENAPKLVFAFIDRTDAVVTGDDWDTLGMRGTQSRTTRLNGAIAAPEHVVRRIDPAPNPDPIVFDTRGNSSNVAITFPSFTGAITSGTAAGAFSFGPDDNDLTSEQWANPEDRTLALRRATHSPEEEVEVIVLCLNASHEDVVFRMPGPGEDWHLLFDSTAPDLEDEPVALDDEGRPAYQVPARGLALLSAAVPKDEDPSR